jgi:hypothetical protein
MELKRKDLALMVLFVISLYILFSKLLWPSTLEVTYIQGTERITKVVPSIFSYGEGLLMAFAGIIFGFAICYLFATPLPPGEKMEASKDWKKVLKKLKGTEKRIYALLMENDGFLFQKEVLEQVHMPKSTLTVTLDRMEAKKLLKRERRGMGNVVVLT